jgi:uncharacterized membrane protein
MQPIIKSRFEQFSDGVFAIAITLLAIELHAPEIVSRDLVQAIRDLAPFVPSIATFVTSFVTIAIFWVNHHQLTALLQTVNQRRILWANVLFLLFLTLIPFVTHALSFEPFNPTRMIGYCLVLLGGSLSFSLLRYFIHRSLGEVHIPMRRSAFGPIVYLLAAFVALVSVTASYILVAIPALYYFLPKSSS